MKNVMIDKYNEMVEGMNELNDVIAKAKDKKEDFVKQVNEEILKFDSEMDSLLTKRTHLSGALDFAKIMIELSEENECSCEGNCVCKTPSDETENMQSQS